MKMKNGHQIDKDGKVQLSYMGCYLKYIPFDLFTCFGVMIMCAFGSSSLLYKSFKVWFMMHIILTTYNIRFIVNQFLNNYMECPGCATIK